ncbi:hypothetical protein DT73_16055 [Mangrovibacter sp. MFB070]|nr:hypothetical protein DT73_16055 [Mangrovibacter sp. MFB070]
MAATVVTGGTMKRDRGNNFLLLPKKSLFKLASCVCIFFNVKITQHRPQMTAIRNAQALLLTALTAAVVVVVRVVVVVGKAP